MIRRPPRSTLFPTRRSSDLPYCRTAGSARCAKECGNEFAIQGTTRQPERDRKSTRLNSSHGYISYAVFCLKKKKKQPHRKEATRHTHSANVHYVTARTTGIT